MKIALVHLRHAATGGTERYLNQIAAFLAARGDDVAVVCRRHGEAPDPRVRFVRLHGLALGATWRVASFARSVARHLRRERYDVVFGLGRTWTQDVLRLGGGTHATYLETAHDAARPGGGRRALGPKHRLALAIERRALSDPALERVVVNSAMVARDVERRYAVAPGRIELVYNGVDLERFHPRRREREGRALRAELGLGADDLALLFLGSGYGRKGLDLVLEALPAVLRAAPRARLVVAGWDSSAAAYQRRAAELGVADRVRFLGGRDDAEAVYAACDLYALPTRYDPFANATLEALASGLPVVTSAANGACELVTEGLEGSVVRAEATADELAAALSRWCSRERLAEAALAARALAERHPARRTAEESARVLDAAAAAKRAAPALGRAR